MADDGKRTENVCAKVTERMALDLLRAATRADVKVSNYLYRLIRLNLYGVSVDINGDDAKLPKEPTSDDG